MTPLPNLESTLSLVLHILLIGAVAIFAAVGLYLAYYSFCRVHSSLRVTPAMEAGITDHVWELKELLAAA